MDEDRQALDAELVPLSVAATVAYFHLTNPRVEVEQADSRVRAVARAALALAQLSAIFVRASDGRPQPINAEELRRLLVDPILDQARHPDLDRFLIRRADLRAALVTLRDARGRFVSSRH
jgi:hypothetical protein